MRGSLGRRLRALVRKQEIGLRLTIGARPVNILNLRLGQGLKLAVMGVMVGVVAAFFCTRLLSHLLFNINAFDPVALRS